MSDLEVADKLYRRALGYSHEAVKIFMPAGSDEPVYASYTEHYPPDTTAAIFWLKNRSRAYWRDKQDHEHSATIRHELTPEERDTRVRRWLGENGEPPEETPK